MRRIALTRHQTTIVDDSDYDVLARYKWRAIRARQREERWYAVTGSRRVVLMHRMILGLPPGHVPEVDHRNGDGLDNRRQNLRAVSRSENACNRATPASGATRVGRRWKAQIRRNGQQRHLGMFATREQAEAAFRAESTGE